MTTTLIPPNVNDAATTEGAASSLLGATAGELVLRMNSGPQAGRVIRLSAAKCTIGSSPDCTLRLRGAGIEPVHCMIVRGAKQTIVRRWSSDTRVNDRHFDDIGLRDGDRLAVGPVEFQVLKASGSEAAPVRTARRIETELAATTSRIERLTERLDLANRQGRRRLRAVLARLRKYQLRLNDIEGRRSQLAQEQERLQAETVRLAEQNTELKTRKLEWQREREALERQSRDATQNAETLTAEQARLNQAEQKLRDSEADLVGRVTALEDRLAHLAAGERKLAARESDVARQADELRRQAADLEARENETARRLSEVQNREKEAADRLAAIQERDAETLRRQSAIQDQETEVARRSGEVQTLDAEVSRKLNEIQEREAAAAAAADVARRAEAEVAARCEALKNHWAELIERERSLEQDRERLDVRERELNAAQAAAAAAVAPVLEPVATPVVIPVADVEAAAEARRRLDEERRALDEERCALDEERCGLDEERAQLAAETAAIEQSRLELSKQETELTERRTTLELAARVLDRRAELAEADEAKAAEAMCAAEAAKAEPTPESVVQETSLNDQLRIEHLEALVKTWRNEAELWKSRFDEFEFGDKATIDPEPHSDRDREAVPHEDREPQPETDVLTAASVEDVDFEETVPVDMASEIADAEPEEVAAESELEEPVEAAVVEAPKEVKAESAAEVLRRLGMVAALDDDSPAAAAPPPPPPATSRPAPQAKAPEHHEGDESLDDYMQQLFQRLGVKQQSPAAPVAPSRGPGAAKPEAVVEASKPAEPAVQQAPLTASEFKARSVAAERKSDLSALRELANNTAKAAIAKHQVTTQSSKSKWKLMTAAGGLAIAGVSAWSYLVLGHDAGKYGLIGGAVLAVYSVLQSAGLKHGATKSARSLDDVLQKSAGRAPTKEAAE